MLFRSSKQPLDSNEFPVVSDLEINAGIYTDITALLSSRHWASKLNIFPKQAARSMLLGETRSRFRGRGMEFEEVRAYQPGDDVRNIDWRVSARVGGTFTRLYCEERERPVHLVLDQRSNMFFGSNEQFKSVQAVKLASAIAWAALAGSDRIGGQIISDQNESDIRAKRNKSAVLSFIQKANVANHQLSAKQQNKTESASTMKQILESCKRITRPGTAIFVISDFYDFDQAAAKQLTLLGKHTDVYLLQITDKIEQSLPLAGELGMSNGDTSQTFSMNSAVKEAYIKQYNESQELLKISVRQSHAAFIECDSDSDARTLLNLYFGQVRK